jgi:drug/metabolite transporter (DMT)-like permease
MLTILFGLGGALNYGFADFFAALASRKIRVLIVSAVASFSGFLFQLLVLPLLGASFTSESLFWGFLAGLCSVVALVALYASLALGPISVISPLGALVAALVPALIGVFLLGESFSFLGWIAIGIALVAIFLVAFIPGADVRLPKLRATLLAIIAGASIGLAIFTLSEAPEDSGIAAIITMRFTAALILGLASLYFVVSKISPRAIGSDEKLGFKVWGVVVLTGVLDACANIFFILATQTGSLSVVGVLTALYPIGTILLARFVLREKVAKSQALGIVLAITACVFLAIP